MTESLHPSSASGSSALDPLGLGLTPSATVGPYLAIGLYWPDGEAVYSGEDSSAITIDGVLYDGNNEIIPDGMIEIWQADPAGAFNHPDDRRGGSEFPGFRGFGRSCTDSDGRFWFRTLKPGRLPAEAGAYEAPHIDVSVFARGMLNRVVTRIYFDDEGETNAADPVLASLHQSERQRLLAHQQSPNHYHVEIYLQGEHETPFFRV